MVEFTAPWIAKVMAFDSVPTLTVTVSRSGVELAISQV